MERKIAIIDPVGIKSGMNHYDSFLAQSLHKLKVQCYVYSNFKIQSNSVVYKSYFGMFFNSIFAQTIDFIPALIKSCMDCKRKQVKYVILHVFSTHHMAFLSYLIVKLFGLKTISIAHDVASFTQQDNKFYHHLIYNYWSNHIVVHNLFSKEHLLPQIKATTHSRVKIIKHGAFTDLPNKEISNFYSREQLNLQNDKQYLLFFGRLKGTKRLDVLLKAMPNVMDSVHLIVAGHSGKEDFQTYQNIINELGLKNRVTLDINYITEEKRELYFKAVDAMILPYDTIFQSGVLLMSMSYGIAVIASDIKPFTEIIEPTQNGLLFERGNSTDLAQKINLMMSNKSIRERCSKQSVECMKQLFSWDDIARDYVDILVQ